MVGTDFTSNEEAVFRALGLLKAPPVQGAKESMTTPTLCPPGPSVAARVSALKRPSKALTNGVQSKGSGFLAPVTFGYGTGPKKDTRRQSPCLRLKLPRVGCEWVQRQSHTTWCKGSNFPNNTTTCALISIGNSTSLPPTNCCLLKRDQHSRQT